MEAGRASNVVAAKDLTSPQDGRASPQPLDILSAVVASCDDVRDMAHHEAHIDALRDHRAPKRQAVTTMDPTPTTAAKPASDTTAPPLPAGVVVGARVQAPTAVEPDAKGSPTSAPVQDSQQLLLQQQHQQQQHDDDSIAVVALRSMTQKRDHIVKGAIHGSVTLHGADYSAAAAAAHKRALLAQTDAAAPVEPQLQRMQHQLRHQPVRYRDDPTAMQTTAPDPISMEDFTPSSDGTGPDRPWSVVFTPAMVAQAEADGRAAMQMAPPFPPTACVPALPTVPPAMTTMTGAWHLWLNALCHRREHAKWARDMLVLVNRYPCCFTGALYSDGSSIGRSVVGPAFLAYARTTLDELRCEPRTDTINRAMKRKLFRVTATTHARNQLWLCYEPMTPLQQCEAMKSKYDRKVKDAARRRANRMIARVAKRARALREAQREMEEHQQQKRMLEQRKQHEFSQQITA